MGRLTEAQIIELQETKTEIVKIAKGCLICGEGVAINYYMGNESVICDKCKAAVMKVREEIEVQKETRNERVL